MNKPNYSTPPEHRGYKRGWKREARHLDYRAVGIAKLNANDPEFMAKYEKRK